MHVVDGNSWSATEETRMPLVNRGWATFTSPAWHFCVYSTCLRALESWSKAWTIWNSPYKQGGTLLGSLKHKAEGGRLTDLSTDFWKSVWIWLQRYTDSGVIRSSFRFLLFTTETVPNNSFLSTYVALLHEACLGFTSRLRHHSWTACPGLPRPATAP